jgi:phospholipid transport system substrate-binding protein
MRGAAGVLAAVSAAAVLTAAAAGPKDTLIARDRQIRQILGEPGRTLSAGDDARLRALVNDTFDYETHARESFGALWNQMNERDRAEGLRLVTLLLERASMDKVHEYRTDRIEYVSEQADPAGPGSATVVTRVTRKRETWEIGYRMRLSGPQWRIVDVVVEGASSIENNRAAFQKEIRASGIQGLLGKLRRKADQR